MKSGRSVVITGAAGGMAALFGERLLDNSHTATDASEDARAALKAERGADALNVVLGEPAFQLQRQCPSASRSRDCSLTSLNKSIPWHLASGRPR